ncbi:MAG: DUF4139 domain-containing protein [Steroidobacteraceae bacterium]
MKHTLLLPLILSGTAALAATDAEDTAITIYSSARPGAVSPELYRPVPGSGVPNAMSVPGYAMVRHERTVKLDSGRTTQRFADVAGLIDPTTVTFSSLTDPATRVLEQNFQFDLVSTDKLLLKYIDRPITVDRANGGQSASINGTLLSATDGLVIKGSDGSITALRDYTSVRFQELPGGLITRPTLMWDINSTKAGEQRARVTYQTSGMTWWADYNLIFNAGKDANNGFIDLSAWVSIINQSGASYPNAKLKLIAGDVHRAPAAPSPKVMYNMAARAEASADAGFAEQAFDEFHLYTLGRRTVLPNNSTKQIELFDQAKQIPAKRLLVYNGAAINFGYGAPMTDRNFGVQSNPKVDSYLEFKNDKQYGLGVPLPSGRVRVSKIDSGDNSLEFIGEDVIDHTPKDETLRLKLGSAFDVVGERRQVDYAVDTKARWLEEEIEVKVRNHKEEAVDVQVKENLYRWSNWKVLTQSQKFERADERTVYFPVKIAANGEAAVRYRVRYSW